MYFTIIQPALSASAASVRGSAAHRRLAADFFERGADEFRGRRIGFELLGG